MGRLSDSEHGLERVSLTGNDCPAAVSTDNSCYLLAHCVCCAAAGVRRRLRRPSTHKTSSSSASTDQEPSASVNRFKVRSRLNAAAAGAGAGAAAATGAVVAASRKSSTVTSVAAPDKDGYKVRVVGSVPTGARNALFISTCHITGFGPLSGPLVFEYSQ